VGTGDDERRDRPKLTEHKVLLDTLWVMVAAFLVFWMQAGFAYVEGGLTRAKNTNNIMMKNLMDFSLGSLAYWAVGFAIMFGAGNAFMGTSAVPVGARTTRRRPVTRIRASSAP
jgi:Amt family ammonium transporter